MEKIFRRCMGVPRRLGIGRVRLLEQKAQILLQAVGGHRAEANGLECVATCCYILHMRVVGIRSLNSRLSHYVRLAASGETVLVSDHDRVVAELRPPGEARSPILADAVLAEAVRQGWLTPPAVVTGGAPPAAEPVAPLRDLLDELERDRSDR